MFWLITLGSIASIIIYLRMPGGKLWKQYVNDIKKSLNAAVPFSESKQVFTENSIARLPALLQQHLINGGYLNTPLMDNMLINFHNTYFRAAAGKKPIPIKFMQVNFAFQPDRHAFLSGRIAGILLQAKDNMSDGYGSMTGVLAKHFQLFCSTGVEMDQGQLITALADAVFMPSLFLQEYISWSSIDPHTIEGVITWKSTSARGRFTFDDNGSIIRFDTNDRYMDENGKGSSPVPWFVTYSNYKNQNGYYQPSTIEVNWMLPDGDDKYFMSDKIEIQYSFRETHLSSYKSNAA